MQYVSSYLVHKQTNKQTSKQTDKQTNTGKSITTLVEVVKWAFSLERVKQPVVSEVSHGVSLHPVCIKLLNASKEVYYEYLENK